MYDHSNQSWCVFVVYQWSLTWWSGFNSDVWIWFDWLKSDDAASYMWFNICDGSVIISE